MVRVRVSPNPNPDPDPNPNPNQYTAVGKGCQDILFFLIEGYEVEECRRLEPIVMAHYHSSLMQRGVTNYTFDDLRRDWKLACMHFPLYVALWRAP